LNDAKRQKIVDLLARIEEAEANDRAEAINEAHVVIPKTHYTQLLRVVDAATPAAAKLKTEYDRVASDDPPPIESWAEGEHLTEEIEEFARLQEHVATERSRPGAQPSREVYREINRRVFARMGLLNYAALITLQASLVETVAMLYKRDPLDWFQGWVRQYEDKR
jgi:hypothetical protein